MRNMLYAIWQATWGLPQTVAGFAVFLAHRKRPHWIDHGIVVTSWPSRMSMSLGLFAFVTDTAPSCRNLDESDEALIGRMFVHEYGHTVQSAILGPLYLLVVGLPSVIWANSRQLAARRRDSGSSYYAFLPERSANALGERMLKQPSMGYAVID